MENPSDQFPPHRRFEHSGKGVCIQGEADVILDPARQLPLLRESMRRRGTPADQLPAEARPGSAFIHIVPKKVISWDYAKG